MIYIIVGCAMFLLAGWNGILAFLVLLILLELFGVK